MAHPIPGPTLFQPARCFVNRDEPLRDIQRRINAVLRGAPVDDPFINVYGAHGIGKTALLAHLQNQYGEHDALVVICLTLPQQADNWQAYIAQALRAEVRRVLGEEVHPALAGAALQSVVARLLERTANRSVLLLCDGWEYIDRTEAKQIGKLVLLPLLQSRQCVAVFASRRRCDNVGLIFLYHRIYYIELHQLDTAASAIQIAPAGVVEQAVVALTTGYPLANEIAYYELQADRPLVEVERAVLAHTISAIRSRLGDALTDLEWDVFLLVAVLRRFRDELVHELAAHFIPSLQHWSMTEAVQMSRRFVTLALCRQEQGSRVAEFFGIPQSLYVIVTRELQRTAAERAQEIHRVAAAYYAQCLPLLPGTRAGPYLVEYCFHLLASGAVTVVDLPATFGSWIERLYYSPDRRTVATAGLRELHEVVLNDPTLQTALLECGCDRQVLAAVVEQHLLGDQ
jgi:hypothetical protein